MIAKDVPALFAAVAPALGDHLWQSTVGAVAAGLLTLMLRKNHPRVRYWVWFAASVKFLIPFSLLISLGSHLAPIQASSRSTALSSVMSGIGQPFTRSAVTVIAQNSSASSLSGTILLSTKLLVTIWFFGFVAVLARWFVRWRKISAAVREAVPLSEGREIEALRRIERITGTRNQIEMRQSGAALEPGVFGMLHPVLVWPKGIAGRLSDAHIEAILAHELRHVRHRDNLTGAIHMVAEAVFWFHPLVWWLGAQLLEERERACDEDVLELGSERQIYAESILKVCEFCVESPIACVSGVAGANLKTRMVNIMTRSVPRRLNFLRKLLLSSTALAVITVPILLGLANPAQSQAETESIKQASAESAFEVISIRPAKAGAQMTKWIFSKDTFTGTNVTLGMLIQQAYGVLGNQITGGPDWLGSAKYDFDAKMTREAADELAQLSDDKRDAARSEMLRALLRDRFNLLSHSEPKQTPVYALVVAPAGARLQEADSANTYANGIKGPDGHPAGPHRMQAGPGFLHAQALPLSDVSKLLAEQSGRPVMDRTGLTGKYDFTLRWPADGTAPPSSDNNVNALAAALQEQLGLRLEPATDSVELLVIDHAEKPAGN